MKLLIVLISLLISIVSCSNQLQFANFEGSFNGESDNTCSNSTGGISYSVAINKCMINIGGFNDVQPEIGNALNWFLDIEADGQLQINQYKHNESTCLYGLENQINATVNQCLQVPDFQQVGSTNYTTLSITDLPVYPTNSLTISQYNPQNFNCDVNNLQWSASFSNNFSISNVDGWTTTYICTNGKPYLKNCFYGKCYIDEQSTDCNVATFQTFACQI